MTVRSTHSVVVGPDRVTKTYRDWSRGEHRREAAALVHLAAHVPGLAPALLDADLTAEPPTLVMTRLGGSTIGRRWSAAEIARLHASLERLWAVPPDALRPLPGEPAHRIAFWHDLVAARLPLRLGAAEQAVLNQAVGWLDSDDAARLGSLDSVPVFGHGDPRAANLLVDGDVVRLVDFEDAGRSHRAYELANTVEHLGNRGLGFEALLELDIRSEPADVLLCRRLVAMFWFLLLAPGGPAATRNPPGTFERQAERLDDLLG